MELLRLPSAVNVSGELDLAKDRHIAPLVRLGQTFDRLALSQLQSLSDIPVAMGSNEALDQGVADPQQMAPELLLQHVSGLTLDNGFHHIGRHLLKLLLRFQDFAFIGSDHRDLLWERETY